MSGLGAGFQLRAKYLGYAIWRDPHVLGMPQTFSHSLIVLWGNIHYLRCFQANLILSLTEIKATIESKPLSRETFRSPMVEGTFKAASALFC